ncbi:MAG: DUF1566 domain-containing protein [Burkholderiales bacterium]|nr:DUF1566 domain-containing protein [Burkholderiales bacterium]
MNAKQLFCKWEKSADGRLATGWHALLSGRLNTDGNSKPAMNEKRSIRKAVALTALALATTTAQAIDLRSWDRKIDSASERFQIVLGGEAVLDKETQLVWEKFPSSGATVLTRGSAKNTCLVARTGARKGWRLPSVHELNSLVDPTVRNGVTLPADHPFSNVSASNAYWTATTVKESPTLARTVLFDNGGFVLNSNINSPVNLTWCVRGGAGEGDEY